MWAYNMTKDQIINLDHVVSLERHGSYIDYHGVDGKMVRFLYPNDQIAKDVYGTIVDRIGENMV